MLACLLNVPRAVGQLQSIIRLEIITYWRTHPLINLYVVYM